MVSLGVQVHLLHHLATPMMRGWLEASRTSLACELPSPSSWHGWCATRRYFPGLFPLRTVLFDYDYL